MSNYNFKKADPELVEKILNAVALGGDGCPGTCSLADQLRNQCRAQTVAEAEHELVDAVLRWSERDAWCDHSIALSQVDAQVAAVREARAAEQKEEQET